jgi:hypothetical protein
VGVGNPAEETCCHPNTLILGFGGSLSTGYQDDPNNLFCDLKQLKMINAGQKNNFRKSKRLVISL